MLLLWFAGTGRAGLSRSTAGEVRDPPSRQLQPGAQNHKDPPGAKAELQASGPLQELSLPGSGLDQRGTLSPRIVEAIVEGRQPSDLTVIALIRRIELPLLWSAQEQALNLRSSYHADEDSRALKSMVFESPLHDQKRFFRNPDIQRRFKPSSLRLENLVVPL
jgi:hypothetical protein